jgi:16S rRNA (uracil1498-N3)-methyltransferase
VSPATIERGDRRARWQRIAIASAKQCGRAVVPDVRPPLQPDQVLRDDASCVMLVEPGVTRESQRVRDLPAMVEATLLVGPEGGWTPDEVAAAAASKARLVTLGPRTLRADAVPMVALTALRVHWEDD